MKYPKEQVQIIRDWYYTCL